MKQLSMYATLFFLALCALVLILGGAQLPAISSTYAKDYPEFSSLRIPWLALSILSTIGMLAFLGAVAIISGIAHGRFPGSTQLRLGRFMSWAGPTLTAVSLILMGITDMLAEAGPISIPAALFILAFFCIFVALLSRALFRLIDLSFAMKAEIDQVI